MGIRETDTYTMANGYNFDTRACRRCNPTNEVHTSWTQCPDCDGWGHTQWAALATSPWDEVLPNLWLGGCEYNANTIADGRSWTNATVSKNSPFKAVVTMYAKWQQYGPGDRDGIHHYLFPIQDSALTNGAIKEAYMAADMAMNHLAADEPVLIRCQAGLNRSGLVTGLVLIEHLGWPPDEAIALMRHVRSPWVLCNQDFEDFLMAIPTPTRARGWGQ